MAIAVKRIQTADSPSALKTTIQLIGQGIRAGAQYFPLRALAARLATQAKPKDYMGQVRAIYDDFTRNKWRYVHDPAGIESVVVSGPAILSQVLGVGAPKGQRGYGDCDDCAVGIGSLLSSVGINLKIVTSAPPGHPGLFKHVFLQADVPGHGSIWVDPVLYPSAPLGSVASHARLAVWSLAGDLLETRGQFPPEFQAMVKRKGAINMSLSEQFPDQGLYQYGLCGANPAELLDWNQYGVVDFGQYAPEMGLIGDASNFVMEYDEEDLVPGTPGLVVTKSLELAPDDWREIIETGSPRLGSVALADDGDVYQYAVDPLTGLGFFKKLFRRVKKRVKKVWKKVKGAAKRLISKLPGGKYLIKLYGKVHKIAKKLVKPLKRALGKFSKYAKFLAPIAAFIPGVGPAIAGVMVAMHKAGKIKKLLKRFKLKTDKKGKPKFTSGKQAAAFKKQITAMAKREKQKQRRRKKSAVRRGRKRPLSIRKARIAAMLRARRRGGRIRPRGRVYGAGTPEHDAVMRGLGLQ